VFAYIGRRLVLMMVTLFGILGHHLCFFGGLLSILPATLSTSCLEAAGLVDPRDRHLEDAESDSIKSIVVQILHSILGEPLTMDRSCGELLLFPSRPIPDGAAKFHERRSCAIKSTQSALSFIGTPARRRGRTTAI